MLTFTFIKVKYLYTSIMNLKIPPTKYKESHSQIYFWNWGSSSYPDYDMWFNLFHVDLQYVASQSDLASHSKPSKVSLKCFYDSLGGISSTALFSDIPACSKPTTGYGILINLTGRSRWQPFATWTIKLLSKIMTEGTLYVEGLISTSCIVAACTLLCHGNAELQMVGSITLQVWIISSALIK